ncbi:MAG: hypothetical protein EBR82_11575 [Caulobacteraceae bacterium]|nr:hypothetical protein [Caulobacteraceae bacterium]
MSAISQIPQYFTTEFTSNWEHLLQQKVSKLREYVSVESVRGKEKTFNQLAAVEMTKITNRASDTNISDVTLAKRWLRPYPYEHATLFDEWDAEYLGEVSLPQSETVSNHAMAYMRTCDKVIIDAALGTAYTGETGVTPTSLPSGQKVAVDYVETGSAANSGLTIAKLRQAAYLLNDAEVDDSDPRVIVVSAKQIQDLLRTTEVTSADYNSVKALVQGQLDTFMGFKFRRVASSLLPYNANTGVRTCFAYVRSGVKLADAGRKVHVDIRADKSHALQIRTVASLGATRMEEKKVVEVAADEVL